MFTKYFRNVRLWSVLCVCEREKRVCVSKIIERCVCVCVRVCVWGIDEYAWPTEVMTVLCK